MAPKKHTCIKTSRDVEWVKSTLTEEDINGMVVDGIILDRERGEWRPATDELFSTPHTHEMVVFEGFYVQGLGSMFILSFANCCYTMALASTI